ncbi:ABC transporter permease [Arthrobacter sp. ISL-28]|uniref:PhnE/PtxC family ABC transporter permease n=1 Tax=Arthrobacter sp. ISL-28 TaxID=2819108 RepID=UPI0020359673|nr:hypothetical protein [Arthrobacter sp. ISL-28]
MPRRPVDQVPKRVFRPRPRQASNIAPRWVYTGCRAVLNVLRSIPELIYALMFVSAVGLGPFAGILAIVLGSVGSIDKIYA